MIPRYHFPGRGIIFRGRGTDARWSAADLLNRPRQVLVGGMQVDAGDEQAGVASEPLDQQEITGRLVDSMDGCVAQVVKAVPLVEPGPLLPVGKNLLSPAPGQPMAQVGDEQRRTRLQQLAATALPHEELPQLGLQPPGQEDVARAATLGDPEPHTRPGLPITGNVPDIQRQDLVEPQPCP